MFTGIIKKIGVIELWNKEKRTLAIKSDFSEYIIGESISCSGVCLTVTEFKKDTFYCDLSSETILKTNLKRIKTCVKHTLIHINVFGLIHRFCILQNGKVCRYYLRNIVF